MVARLRGVVFDLDGTLVLSHHDFAAMQTAILRAAEEHGGRAEAAAPPEVSGTSRTMAAAREAVRSVDPHGTGPLPSFERESARAVTAVELGALERTLPRDGASSLLERLDGTGLRLALFTRSSSDFCRAVLAKLGWVDRFSFVRSGSARGPSKPSPAALHRLLDEMGLTPSEVAYVGDHPEDARCAASLSVPFYAVLPDPTHPAPWSAEEFRGLGAKRSVANLSELESVFGERWTLRPAALSDAASLLRCLRSAFEAYRADYTEDAFEDTVLTERTVEDRLRAMRVWVAVDETATVRGTLAWGREPGGTAHLRGMAVEPAWQGSALAQRLLDRVLLEAKLQGVRTVTLDTTAPLARAVRFYRRNGFRPTASVRNYFGMPLYEYARSLGGPTNQDGS